MREAKKEDGTKYIDYLDEDEVIPRQKWVCVSFLSPEGIMNCSIRGLKIRGVFESKDEADEHAHKLQDTDPDFHVFVGEVGKWLPWDPDPNSVEDNKYREEELNKLMKGYKENQDKSRKVQDQRKEDMMKQAAAAEKRKGVRPSTQDRAETQRAKMKKNAEAKRQEREAQELANKQFDTTPPVPPDEKENVVLTEKEKELHAKEETLKDNEILVKKERERLEQTDDKIKERETQLNTLDEELDHMKKLFEKMKQAKGGKD